MQQCYKITKITYFKSFLLTSHSRLNINHSEYWNFLLDVVKQTVLNLNFETKLNTEHFSQFYVNKGLDKRLEVS